MLSSLKQELQEQSWIPILTAGLVMGITVILTGIIPMAALVFSGELDRFLATGISLALMSAAVIGVVLALRSSFVGMVAFLLAEEATILGAMATTIAKNMPANATDQDILMTIVAAIAGSSVLTGAFLFALGRFRLGEIIRFLPYPVVGGFLAGLGYLITEAAFRVVTNGKYSFVNFPQLLQPETLLQWVPAVAFGILLLLVSRRPVHYLVLPGLILGAIALFYLVLALAHLSPAQALQGGWLLGPFPEGGGRNPFNLTALLQANWSLILPQFSNMAVLMLITALSLLLVCSALELMVECNIDLNQELQATGLGCLLSGLFGGMVGSPAVLAALSGKVGARSRLTGLVTALVYLGVLLAGVSFFTFFPKPVLGGLLVYLGLDLLVLQLYDGWFKLPKIDYAIVLLIMATVVLFGFLIGVAVGLVVMIILFAWNYSQINVARHTLSGSSFSSHRKRPINQERLLQEKGDQTYVMTLQGYIFFGTANRLLNQIRQRLKATDTATLHFVILDFQWVTGLDSSAIVSFVKLKQLAHTQQFQIVFTNLSPALAKLLHQSRLLAPEDPICFEFPDLDRGLEWCENQVLSASKYRRSRFLPLSLLLKTILTEDNEQISTLMGYLETLQVEKSQPVFCQGDTPDAFYFVESGEISTFVELETGKTQRVQTLGAGTILGEVEFYTQAPYALSAIAEKSSKLYGLRTSALQTMQQAHPQLAATLSNFMMRSLANRLASVQKEITHLTTR
ncbi:SulP family inorganic anion transporter [Leptolyngbya sp. GGD]|uniref:SulP family inorganic anion transporter n=1 Tax=Leptolyngbya sp. GGD TaxID=2997907 RepID=UPI00227B7308|nr:SulP family inorganic anion transporter [Leptolyngbya sp. GGD]MCY6490320.1 SulP family inorganic anion transporter [Leptolyngbya sp. GGD]